MNARDVWGMRAAITALAFAFVACAAAETSRDEPPPDVESFAGERPTDLRARAFAEAAIRELLDATLRHVEEHGTGNADLEESIRLLGDLDQARFDHAELVAVRQHSERPQSWVWAQRCTVVFRYPDEQVTGQRLRWTVYLRHGEVVDQRAGAYGAPYVTVVDLTCQWQHAYTFAAEAAVKRAAESARASGSSAASPSRCDAATRPAASEQLMP